MTLLAACWLALGACSTSSPTGAPGDTARKAPRSQASRPRGDPARAETQRSKPAAPEHDFAVTTFSGDTFRLSEHLGTAVVLNFWESW